MSKTVAKWALIMLGAVALLVFAALAVPVQLWRTGEVPQPELQLSPPSHDTSISAWVPCSMWNGATSNEASPNAGKARLAPLQDDVKSRMTTRKTGRPTKLPMLSA